MTTLDNREKGFENRFAHDGDMLFKAEARRDKLLGLWLAEEMGLSGKDADNYAMSVVVSDLKEPGYEDVIGKVMADIEARDLDISRHRLDKKMEELFIEAKQQIFNEV